MAALADDEGRAGGRFVVTALNAIADVLADAEDELGRIDAVAGDGDHGRGMVKGSSAARVAAAEASDAGAGQARCRRGGQGVGRQGGRHLRVLWVRCSPRWALDSGTPADPTRPPWARRCATATTR